MPGLIIIDCKNICIELIFLHYLIVFIHRILFITDAIATETPSFTPSAESTGHHRR